jgi:hypothetical protein
MQNDIMFHVQPFRFSASTRFIYKLMINWDVPAPEWVRRETGKYQIGRLSQIFALGRDMFHAGVRGPGGITGAAWYGQEFGGGVLVLDPAASGRTFIRRAPPGEYADLEFVSRA